MSQQGGGRLSRAKPGNAVIGNSIAICFAVAKNGSFLNQRMHIYSL